MKKWLHNVMSHKNELSVIIPTFNNVLYLKECLDSVAKACKKCCDYEVLLGIDNCRDTLQFLDSCSVARSKHVRVFFFPKNVGPYIIRNSLAKIAKYDNILFFDSDDVLMKNTIQTLMKKFSGKDILKYKFYNFTHGKNYNDIENLALSPIFSHGSFLIKKQKFLEMNGFFGWKCGADTEFDDRCNGMRQYIHKLDVPVFYRRYHGKNVTILPETGINSSVRKIYGEFIMNRRANNSWKNPEFLETFNYNLVNI